MTKAEVEAYAAWLKRQPDALRFAKQTEVSNDPSPLRAMFCSRRAGKTEEFCFEASEAITEYQDAHVVFIGLSAKSARNIFYSKFKRLNTRYSWGFETNETTLSIRNPKTNSQILVFGSDNVSDVEKILGLSRLVLLEIDEAGAWRQGFLKYVIEEVAGPAMEDIEGSRILVGGTPGREHFGYWYDLTTGAREEDGSLVVPGFKVFSWTLADNPFMPAGILERVLEKYHWTPETPAYVQQYLGRWCLDTSTLVFSTFTNANLVSEAQKQQDGRPRRILAADFGVEHKTSLGILEALSDGRIHVPWSNEWQGLAPTQAADIMLDLQRRWTCEGIVGDLGGMGKAFGREMELRHGVQIQPADKKDKFALIEMVKDEFRNVTLTIDPAHNPALLKQIKKLQWNDDHTDIAEGQSDDSADMLCYGVGHLRAKIIGSSRWKAALDRVGL